MIGRLLPIVSNDLSKDDKDESVKSMGILQNSYVNVGEGSFPTRTWKEEIMQKEKETCCTKQKVAISITCNIP